MDLMKSPTSFRLSPEALRLIGELAEKLGISQAAVVEISVRALARKEKIQ
jgi:predicted transcriptional regulator